MKWIVFSVLVMLLCGETAYLFVQGTNNGSGMPWQPLPAPPERALHIAHVDGFQGVVETADNKYYTCTFIGDKACWRPIELQQFEPNGYAKLWQPTSEQAPPMLANVTEIKYVEDDSPADFTIEAAAAIQSDGTVQSWRQSRSLIDLLLALLTPLCGAGTGLFVCVFLALILRLWPSKRRPGQKPARRAVAVSR